MFYSIFLRDLMGFDVAENKPFSHFHHLPVRTWRHDAPSPPSAGPASCADRGQSGSLRPFQSCSRLPPFLVELHCGE